MFQNKEPPVSAAPSQQPAAERKPAIRFNVPSSSNESSTSSSSDEKKPVVKKSIRFGGADNDGSGGQQPMMMGMFGMGPPPKFGVKKAEESADDQGPESTATHHERVKHEKLDTSVSAKRAKIDEKKVKRRKSTYKPADKLLSEAEDEREKMVSLQVPTL